MTSGMHAAQVYGQPTLVASYPSMSRKILSWPVPPTGIAPSMDTNAVSYLCLYSGNFEEQSPCPSYEPNCTGGIPKHFVEVYLVPVGGPIVGLAQSFPAVDVPVSG